MKRALMFIALAVGLIASTTFAQTVANGPYYATPSWDQQLPAATRFIVLSNWVDANFPSGGAAVLDRETGLVWERSPSTSVFNWGGAFSGAQVHCNNLAVGNRKGWRLPTIQELTSLIHPTVPLPGPTLPAGHPFSNVQSSVYWSATTGVSSADTAWGVQFQTGGAGLVFDRSSVTNFVWCVRGGQGVDPQ